MRQKQQKRLMILWHNKRKGELDALRQSFATKNDIVNQAYLQRIGNYTARNIAEVLF